MPKIPAYGRQRQKDHKFEAILGYNVRLMVESGLPASADVF